MSGIARRARIIAHRGVLVGALYVSAAISAALAQGVAPGPATEPAREAPRQTDQIQDASRDSVLLRLLQSGRDVAYEDILEHPDDIDLNFAFAQTQLARGDLRGAAATLERILLINADLPRVRLLYAITLFRLDNLDEAERELQAVRLLEMPLSLRAELDRYIEQVRLRRKQTRYTLTTSLGFGYAWNRNSAPSNNTQLVSDIPATVDGHDVRKHDVGFNSVGRLEVSHDLGYQSRHRLTGAATYFRGDQVHLSELDLQAGALEFGGVYDSSPVSIIPNLFARRIMLANKYYGSSKGANLRVEHQWDAATQLYTFIEDDFQKYQSIAESRSSPERDGPQYTWGNGVSYALNPAMRISVELDAIRKKAARNYDSYDGAQLQLSHTWVFGDGMFLLTSVSGEQDLYDENDPLVSGMRRRDRLGKLRMTLGAPLGVLFDGEHMPAILKDVTLSLTSEAVRALSNLENYNYKDRRASIGISKRWEF